MEKEERQLLKKVGLRYVTDQEQGLTRKKAGRGFIYLDAQGQRVTDAATGDRIKQLVIPPAWKNVWICSDPNGHLQATGRDDKGRKQYRYHPKWQEIRNLAKFDRMILFGRALSEIRQQTNAHLHLKGLPREKVLALVVQLLENTLIRVGNASYARDNQSYGLTTLRTRHVDIHGSLIEFEFKGKSGVKHHIELKDKRLAKVIRQCYEIPGYALFQYIDEEGKKQSVDSGDVNDYLHQITGEDFTAKEFRTWAGTVLTAQTLSQEPPGASETQLKKQIAAAIKSTAEQLGNRPATCRKYYVHPRIPEAYQLGELIPIMEAPCQPIENLEPCECAILELLES